mmetsp:Transcript_20673/g.31373  ORF Transcript_20673/g.31373 Transcript_20673/m.31373 type:complete len:258 (-) Transcript_20673:444-1217(-)
MDGHSMLLTNFAYLTSDSNLIAIAEPKEEHRLVVVDELGVARLWVERQGRHVSLGQRDNVVDARVGSGKPPGTLPNVNARHQIVRNDLNRISSTVYARQRIVVRDVTRRNERGHLPRVALLGHSEQFDGSSQGLGISEVDLGQFRNTAAGNLVLLNVDAIRQPHENLELRPGVESAHVEGRISFGVPQIRSLGQRLIVALPIPIHGRQHEVGASVNNTRHEVDFIPNEVTLHATNDGNTTAHRRLVAELRVTVQRRN